jgi:type IV pilus assembly protein PilN
MIKVNLLPLKKRKKSKALPAFSIALILVTLGSVLILAYLAFFFSSRLSDRKETFSRNEAKIAQLKETIKAVDDFEERNRVFKQRNEIIEQLSRNKSVPVKVLDEISALVPIGVWLQAMTVTGSEIKLDGYGFSNPEIVSFVDNIKGSKLFSDAYLQESKSVEVEKIPVYVFKLSFQVKT